MEWGSGKLTKEKREKKKDEKIPSIYNSSKRDYYSF